jgi:general stress protein 26
VTATPRQTLYQLIGGFKTAMLVTRARQEAMHARPLAVADVPEDGEILFATSSRSPKVAEIAADPRVLVTFQGGAQCVCVSGAARVTRDRALIERLWSESWRLWYPAGIDDPDLCLLAVTPTEGEYWDDSGSHGLKSLLHGAKAYLSGERLSTDAAHAHAHVDFEAPPAHGTASAPAPRRG